MTATINLSKHRKMMLSQAELAWDPDRDLDWSSLEPNADLLPISLRLTEILNLTADETAALSQLTGLMAAQAISQHEKVLESVRTAC